MLQMLEVQRIKLSSTKVSDAFRCLPGFQVGQRRIGLQQEGCESYIGCDCLQIPQYLSNRQTGNVDCPR